MVARGCEGEGLTSAPFKRLSSPRKRFLVVKLFHATLRLEPEARLWRLLPTLAVCPCMAGSPSPQGKSTPISSSLFITMEHRKILQHPVEKRDTPPAPPTPHYSPPSTTPYSPSIPVAITPFLAPTASLSESVMHRAMYSEFSTPSLFPVSTPPPLRVAVKTSPAAEVRGV